jgi:hypothetical protein
MTSSSIPAARSHYLRDLLAQVPDPRDRRGRRPALAGLLAAGIAAVIAATRSARSNYSKLHEYDFAGSLGLSPYR